MNLEKKVKIIDAVFFDDEIDYLLFRFTELNDSVDTFIILESLQTQFDKEKTSCFEKNLEKFSTWINKIIHIKSVLPSESELLSLFEEDKSLELLLEKKSLNDIVKYKQIYDLKSKLNTMDLSFDDIILLSQIDELPTIPSIDILHTHLSFEPVVFSQKDFIWGKDFIKTKNHLGTLCFSYSHFVTSNLMFYLPLSENLKSSEITPVNYGYRFSHFYSVERSIDKIMKSGIFFDEKTIEDNILKSRNELLFIDFHNDLKIEPLKKYSGQLPNNINLLDSQKIGREIPKNHLVIIGIDSSYEDISGSYDSISIITHTNNIAKKEVVHVSDNTKIFNIQIPNKKYYDVLIDDNTLENFQKMYFFNETKKVLFSQYPLDIDIFNFYVGGKLKSYTWSQIENEFIYDILHN